MTPVFIFVVAVSFFLCGADSAFAARASDGGLQGDLAFSLSVRLRIQPNRQDHAPKRRGLELNETRIFAWETFFRNTLCAFLAGTGREWVAVVVIASFFKRVLRVFCFWARDYGVGVGGG